MDRGVGHDPVEQGLKIIDDHRTIEEFTDLGAGKPASSEVAKFYHHAFAEFGTRALWNLRELDQTSMNQAIGIAGSLRSEGNLAARALAIQIEQACRAAP